MSNEQEMREADDGSITVQDCIRWLDTKYSRHGELEDKAAADYLRATLAAEARIRELEALLDKASDYIPVRDTECRGYKCRKLNCRSCFDDETVDEYIEESKSLYSAIRAALTEHKENQG